MPRVDEGNDVENPQARTRDAKKRLTLTKQCVDLVVRIMTKRHEAGLRAKYDAAEARARSAELRAKEAEAALAELRKGHKGTRLILHTTSGNEEYQGDPRAVAQTLARNLAKARAGALDFLCC